MRDPVCGMKVAPEKAAGCREHAGETYYFCSQKCLEKFTVDPDRWLQPAERAAEATKAEGKGGHLHLPHASGSGPGGTGRLPGLRYGPGATGADSGGGRER